MARGKSRKKRGGLRGNKSKEPEKEPVKSTIDDEEDDEEVEEEIAEENTKGDTSQSDTNEPTDGGKESGDDDKSTPKKRGRKRKSELPPEEKFVPTPATRGIMAHGGSLRRRDTLKSTARYSPPPVSSTRRPKGNAAAVTTRKNSTDEENVPKPESTAAAPTSNRRKSLVTKTATPSAATTNNEKKTTEDKQKLAVTPADGSDTKLQPPSKKMAIDSEAVDSSKKTKDSDVEAVIKKDKEPEQNSTPIARVTRKKSSEQSQQGSITIVPEKVKSPPPVTIPGEKTASSIKTGSVSVTIPKTQTVAITTSRPSLSVATSKSQSTPIMTTKLQAVTKPIAGTIVSSGSTSTQVSRVQIPTRKPMSLNKYLDSLPEIQECIHNDGIDDRMMPKLPDKILLVNSELPLPMAVSIENEDEPYLFRQIISPVNATRFVCLLCKGIDVNFATKEEKDILLHYQSLHELDVDVGQAKFSEDIVFICLPKMILNQFNNSSSLSLNSPCQYCEARLSDINEMKEHYSVKHKKEVIMMEQEEIMRMHHFFYCSMCKAQSSDFDAHHKHMKTAHQMKTYRCKSCVLVTRDENRLRTHFKAKHMLHSSGQNYQCYYCHGLLIGVERLQKHIQQSHMVLTTPSESSCIACRQLCGKNKELLTHAQNCQLAGLKPEKTNNRFEPIFKDDSPLAEGEVECYFCYVRLESEEAYKLHLHHEHMKWVEVTQNNLENDDDGRLLTLDDIITDEDLNRAKVRTYVGHWCRICDQLIKVYQLYYLHMANFHKLKKMYQCVITSCKKTFKEFEEFKEHIEETNHLQKTIISHPDEVFVCSYCDLYFVNEEELIAHLITDLHINKFTSSGHFHRTEPRNFKCKACHTFFGMKESYIHHLETESHQYVCTYCGITTATPSSRRAHIQNSHAEKLLMCEDCNETHTDMMSHFVLHGYTFECKKCIKKFYNRERLNAHMEVHQDPTECNWPGCNRTIATRSMLVTHYRGHKSEHKCNVCGQAFWNFSMLTSHLRSHQPTPRTPGTSARGSQLKPTVQYQNQARPMPTVLQKPRMNAQGLSNLIRCGNCSALFRTPKELAVHKCSGKSGIINNGSQNKLGATKSGGRVPTRRRASPKKQEPQIMDMTTFQGPAEQQVDDDTQVIMILNQSTGELMEITAPKGMEVEDVINSLNFTPAIEDVPMEAIEEQTQQTSMVQSADPKLKDENEQETAAAIEIIEQATEQNTVNMETNDNEPEAVATNNSTEVLIQQDGSSQIQQIIEEQSGQEQAIVLPPDCINEDGSLTLDAETLQRLNLALSVDENGAITAQEGNATFIIDTSAIKEQ